MEPDIGICTPHWARKNPDIKTGVPVPVIFTPACVLQLPPLDIHQHSWLVQSPWAGTELLWQPTVSHCGALTHLLQDCIVKTFWQIKLDIG